MLGANLDREIAIIAALLTAAHDRRVPVIFSTVRYDDADLKNPGIWALKQKGVDDAQGRRRWLGGRSAPRFSARRIRCCSRNMPRASSAPISCLGSSRIGSIRSSSPVAPRADACARPRSMPARTGSVYGGAGSRGRPVRCRARAKSFRSRCQVCRCYIAARRARLSRTRRLQFRRAVLMEMP
jgi:hypothetical protein